MNEGTIRDVTDGLRRHFIDGLLQQLVGMVAEAQTLKGKVSAKLAWQMRNAQLLGPPGTNLGILAYDLQPAGDVLVSGIFGGGPSLAARETATPYRAVSEAEALSIR